MSDAAARPFGKYERFGAYHWREISASPTRHNAVLTARYQVLLEAIDGRPGRVLDIGCGDGTLTFLLASRLPGGVVAGIDDALLPLQLAHGKFGERRAVRRPLLSRADALQLPFPDEAFDCVVLADVIEHIPQPQTVMSEARRVLRRGGQIVVTTPRRQGDAPAHEYHCTEYTGRELAGLLETSFGDVRVRPFRPTSVTRLYERRVLGRKLMRVAINCLSIAGWNPLARTGDLSSESLHADLCASGRKT